MVTTQQHKLKHSKNTLKFRKIQEFTSDNIVFSKTLPGTSYAKIQNQMQTTFVQTTVILKTQTSNGEDRLL